MSARRRRERLQSHREQGSWGRPSPGSGDPATERGGAGPSPGRPGGGALTSGGVGQPTSSKTDWSRLGARDPRVPQCGGAALRRRRGPKNCPKPAKGPRPEGAPPQHPARPAPRSPRPTPGPASEGLRGVREGLLRPKESRPSAGGRRDKSRNSGRRGRRAPLGTKPSLREGAGRSPAWAPRSPRPPRTVALLSSPKADAERPHSELSGRQASPGTKRGRGSGEAGGGGGSGGVGVVAPRCSRGS